MAGDRNAFRIETSEADGRRVLKLQGVIDEHADLAPLAELVGDAEVSLKGVRRINSFGVRAWVDAVRRIPSAARVVFIECSPPVVDQLNMVGGFLGNGIIESFFAPMLCEECDETVDQLFTVDACRDLGGRLPDVPCPRCGRGMEIDDLEEQYLLFVREPRR